MKKLVAFAALVLVALAPAAAAAQTAASFAGKWEGTYILARPDGTNADPRPIAFDLTQKGKVIEGMAGPPNDQSKVVKGVVNGAKVTFEVPTSNGSTFKFDLTIVKGHLQGAMVGVGADGAVRGNAKVDATKAAAGAKK